MRTAVYCPPCGERMTIPAPVGGRAPCPKCGLVLDGLDRCEVFVSYADQDRAVAQQVVDALQAACIRYWWAREHIGVGQSFAEEIPRALRDARAVILILSSAAIDSPWVEREIEQAISDRQGVFPLRIDAPAALNSTWGFLLRKVQWEASDPAPGTDSIERLIANVEAEIRRVAAPVPDALPVVAPAAAFPGPLGVNPRRSPYVGPQPYAAHMAERFYGRTTEAKALLDAIAHARIVLVYGSSGAGKTSLLNTIVAQGLEEQGIDVMHGARVGGALPESMKAHDADRIANIYSFSAIVGLHPSSLPNPQLRLSDHLSLVRRRPGTRARVIIFDQFEELFTRHVDRHEDRADFFRDLVEALGADPSLRIVLSMRQEYLADIDPLLALLPRTLAERRFALRRLGTDGALEAIVRPAVPYATFAPNVAESIVEQLNIIKARRFDGVVVSKPGEHIEMVQLQIVCERLWANLPAGITTITQADVERAAGEGRPFSEFVARALDEFYDVTIDEIVNSRATVDHGRYPKELVRLGCMKFVSNVATRTMVPRAHGRTGRLPDWIVDQLESHHLLRSEERGGERWYELAHDRLAELVMRQMSQDDVALLFAADLLDKMMERVIAERTTLAGYFGNHEELLAECQPFHAQPGLFPDEAEFLLRASLRTGKQMREWSHRVGADYPDLRRAVLDDALTSGPPTVRCHTATLLGGDPVDALSERLVELTLADDDASVRCAAAVGLARLDDATLHARIVAALHGSRHVDAVHALAQMRVEVDENVDGPRLVATLAQLPRRDRFRVRWTARRIRLQDGIPAVPFIILPTITCASLSAAAFKWLPGKFGYALTQATPSAGMGAFHGLFAGVVWAGSIVLGLTLYHATYSAHHARHSYIHPLGALAVGLAFGVAGSVCVDLAVASVFTQNSLVTMQWVAPTCATTACVWHDLLVTTRFGWVHLVTGAGLGVGMALMTNGLRASAEWQRFLADQRRLSEWPQIVAVTRAAARIAVRHVWILLLAVLVSGVLAALVPNVASAAARLVTAEKIAGDSATQAIGAFFGLIGMGLGLVIERHGLELKPRRGA